MKNLVTVTHGYYQPYFYWMFPILVAKEEGYFQPAGINLEIHDIAPQGQPVNKARWYEKALETRSRDFYFCCAWQGIYSTSETGKGKIGAAIKSSLIKTFAIYTRPDSRISSILDLVQKGVPIAVNKNADAHYVTLKNLSELVPASQVKLAHLGGVEKCFRALISEEVEAATLAGPYAEAAEAIGYRRLLPLSRTEPTVIVFNEALGRETIASFLVAINKAVDQINDDRTKYRSRYVKEFEEVITKYLPELGNSLAEISSRLTLPVWAQAKMLTKEEFEEVHGFLLDHGLSPRGRGYDASVESGLWMVQ